MAVSVAGVTSSARCPPQSRNGRPLERSSFEHRSCDVQSYGAGSYGGGGLGLVLLIVIVLVVLGCI
ncbi:DUF3309 family protein [Mesorhizobium sp. ISC11]